MSGEVGWVAGGGGGVRVYIWGDFRGVVGEGEECLGVAAVVGWGCGE